MKYKTFRPRRSRLGRKNIKSITSALIVFFAIAAPLFVIAAGYIPLESLPGLQVDNSKGVELGSYFKNMYTLIIGIAVVLAVLMIVIAGIEYMSPTPSGKESGKKRAWAAIGGLVLSLISYLILNTINPDLLSTNFGLQEVQITGQRFKVNVAKQQLEVKATAARGSLEMSKEQTILFDKAIVEVNKEKDDLKKDLEAIKATKPFWDITSSDAEKVIEDKIKIHEDNIKDLQKLSDYTRASTAIDRENMKKAYNNLFNEQKREEIRQECYDLSYTGLTVKLLGIDYTRYQVCNLIRQKWFD